MGHGRPRHTGRGRARRTTTILAALAIVGGAITAGTAGVGAVPAGAVEPGGPPQQIVGGSPLGTTDYPALAALLVKAPGYTAQDRFFCTGSLIDSTHVLTAGHCVMVFIDNRVEVQLGSGDLGGTGATVVDAARATVLKKWADRWPSYQSEDLGIITLARAVTNVAPVRLATARDKALVAGGASVRIGGWGYDKPLDIGSDGPPSGARPPVRANVASVPVVGDTDCKTQHANAFGSRYAKEFLSVRTDICAGGVLGVGGCYGDSGGPMWATATDGSGQLLLLGVTSRGHGCATQFPGVWTDVGTTRRWIDRNVTTECTRPAPVSTTTPLYAC